MKIVADNAETEFGRLHGFSSVHSLQEYRAAVPVSDYSAFSSYIDRILSAEEASLLTCYPLKHFLLTSGTGGKQKRILLTSEALKRYSSYIYEYPFQALSIKGGRHLHISVFRSPSAAGTLLSCAYFGYLRENGMLHDFIGGDEFLFADDIDNIPYVKLRLALACRELTSIQAIFLYDTLLVLRYLEENWRLILDDMRNGSFSVPLSDGAKAKLSALARADDERLQELEAVFSEGFSSPIVPRLWPELEFVGGIGGGVYGNQTEILREYIGEVPVYFFAYASSEIMAGVAMTLDKSEYTLLPDSAFYEFVPQGESEAVSEEELVAGGVYELVVTTFSGLYRYRTGDLIRITGFLDTIPRFEIIGRTSQILNIAGEKIDIQTITKAVGLVEAEAGVRIREFSIAADLDAVPGCYWLFAEVKELPYPELSESFDKALRSLSPDYDDIRKLGMLEGAKVCLVPEFFLEEVLFSGRVAHKKAVTILNSEQLALLRKAL